VLLDGLERCSAAELPRNLGPALEYELRKTGVNVPVVVPGTTNTPGLNERTDIDLGKMPGPVMSADKLVSVGLKGLAKNKPLVVAGWSNRVMDFMFRRVLPRQTGRNMMGMNLTKHAPTELTMG
jgi:short-subunit dehydrogenase